MKINCSLELLCCWYSKEPSVKIGLPVPVLRGVRDLGLLESALYRPQTGYYRDLAEMAAALFESLLGNHPFIDGNKRVAFFGTDVFLRLNGWKLDVEPEPAHADLIGLLDKGTADFEHLLAWLRAHLVKL